jgi:8-oxo-dGTP diphosphatase
MIRKIWAKSLIVNESGEVLVLRRSPDDENNPGRVDFPGGGVEPNESYVAAAAREIKEEAGIVLSERELELVYAFTVYDNKSDMLLTRLLYVGHPAHSEMTLSHEHDAYWWRNAHELAEIFKSTAWFLPLHFVLEHKLLEKQP